MGKFGSETASNCQASQYFVPIIILKEGFPTSEVMKLSHFVFQNRKNLPGRFKMINILVKSSLLCFLYWGQFVEGKLKCQIIKNADPRKYKLSDQTIKATSRKNSTIYQVFDCTCPIDTSGREGFEKFGDDIKKELDRYYYRLAQNSQIIRTTFRICYG